MSHRTLKLSLLALGIVGGAVLLLPGAETKPAAPPETIAQLQSQIAKLEERVAQLELRSGLLAYPPVVQPDGLIAQPLQRFQAVPNTQLPEGWQQREFNGAPYYVVPLEAPSAESRRNK